MLKKFHSHGSVFHRFWERGGPISGCSLLVGTDVFRQFRCEKTEVIHICKRYKYIYMIVKSYLQMKVWRRIQS